MARLLLLLLLVTTSVAVSAEIFRWKDANGVIHFSDNAAGQAGAETVEVKIMTYLHVTYQKLKGAAAAPDSSPKRVVLYGTSWCGYCKKARAYFRSRNIPFTDLDVENDAGAKVQFNALGGRGVPVILVGDNRINGFSESVFDGFYNPR